MLSLWLKLGQPEALRDYCCFSKGTRVLLWRPKFQYLISRFVHCILAMGKSGFAWLRTDAVLPESEVLDHGLKLFSLEQWSCWFFPPFGPKLLTSDAWPSLCHRNLPLLPFSPQQPHACQYHLCHDETTWLVPSGGALLRHLPSFWATMGNLSQTLFILLKCPHFKKSMHKHTEKQDQGCSLQDRQVQGTLRIHKCTHPVQLLALVLVLLY